jgi:NAD(P)-dependent dehydrogenase (short-subunit alcohol dehydrogenase family)
MSLANKTCWVVGGVGVIGRAISRSLLGSGATVIVNSREEARLDRLASDLGNPEKLITVHGSLLPGESSATIKKALGMSSGPLNHVVAHGAVRFSIGISPVIHSKHIYILYDYMYANFFDTFASLLSFIGKILDKQKRCM